jgi:hypothetical protein
MRLLPHEKIFLSEYVVLATAAPKRHTDARMLLPGRAARARRRRNVAAKTTLAPSLQSCEKGFHFGQPMYPPLECADL